MIPTTETTDHGGTKRANVVAFDMDGVLVDSERYWGTLASEEILPAVLDSNSPPEESLAGMNVSEQYAYLDENYDVTVTESEYVARYEECAEELYGDKVTLLPGFERVADDLRSRDVGIALASSSPRNWITLVLDRFELHDVFEVVLSVEDIEGDGKPEPDIYHAVADRFDRSPSECLAVEDTDHGLRAANAAGMTCVGFRTDANPEADFGAAEAVASSVDDLRSTLRRRTVVEDAERPDHATEKHE